MEHTHCVLDSSLKKVVGLAGEVEQAGEGESFAFVYLFGCKDDAEYGYIQSARLLPLAEGVEVTEEKEAKDGLEVRVTVV